MRLFASTADDVSTRTHGRLSMRQNPLGGLVLISNKVFACTFLLRMLQLV